MFINLESAHRARYDNYQNHGGGEGGPEDEMFEGGTRRTQEASIIKSGTAYEGE